MSTVLFASAFLIFGFLILQTETRENVTVANISYFASWTLGLLAENSEFVNQYPKTVEIVRIASSANESSDIKFDALSIYCTAVLAVLQKACVDVVEPLLISADLMPDCDYDATNIAAQISNISQLFEHLHSKEDPNSFRNANVLIAACFENTRKCFKSLQKKVERHFKKLIIERDKRKYFHVFGAVGGAAGLAATPREFKLVLFVILSAFIGMHLVNTKGMSHQDTEKMTLLNVTRLETSLVEKVLMLAQTDAKIIPMSLEIFPEIEFRTLKEIYTSMQTIKDEGLPKWKDTSKRKMKV